MTRAKSSAPRRVFVVGATGTIGRATVKALVQAGHDVVGFARPGAPDFSEFAGATIRFGDVTDAGSVARDGFCNEPFDALVSCLTSRTGAPRDAWAIDHAAHVVVLDAAKAAGVKHVVLLSAICVQKPRLAFQHAKLAFEQILIGSGVDYSIVRATAFFKSLSGQIERVKKGKPFLMFGDGLATACKPISDDDLAWFLAQCLDDATRLNQILPIGGPGDAITPRAQADALFALLHRKPRVTHVPIALLDAIGGVLAVLARAFPALSDRAELARIGRYYATESMLVLDPATGRYDSAATPSTGSDTLYAFYARVIAGEISAVLGDHAVF